MTPISVLTKSATEKMGVSDPVLMPDLAVLDPALSVTLPADHTAATGIDAMVHAIEAYTTKLKKNPVSDALALEALRLLATHIRRAVSTPEDREARGGMLLGSMLAGKAFANAPCAAVHALAYPLGARFHLPHGLSNALLLPAVLRFNRAAVEADYARLGQVIFGEASADALIAGYEILGPELGLPARLRETGIGEADLPVMAHDAMAQTRLLQNNPREVSEADALAIYEAAY
jgi:alcohol dehydrogenase